MEERIFRDTTQKVVCNSEMVHRDLQSRYQIAPERITVIPNGIDVDHFHPENRDKDGTVLRGELGAEEAPVWLFAGSGFSRKGLDTALRALDRLSDAPARARLGEAARAAAQRLSWDAHVTDLRELFSEVRQQGIGDFDSSLSADAASRSRRPLPPGGSHPQIRIGKYTGLRLQEVAEAEITSALDLEAEVLNSATHRLLKADSRARVSEVQTSHGNWIVKRYGAGGFLRRTADLFRGSPARRAWLGGHGLLLRRIGAATPVAFLERRSWGVPMASVVVLENLQGLETADRCNPAWANDQEVVDAVLRLAIRLHQRGVTHGDLKASHVLLERVGDGIEGRLIDLEGVRFRRRLGDRERIQALAELNATLPDRISAELRCRAFARYAAAVPFQSSADDALVRIVEISLDRQHRWTGGGCHVVRKIQQRDTL